MTIAALPVLAAGAAEVAEPSKTAFYVAGGALAVFAVVLAAIGLSRATFPPSRSAERAVYGVTALLVACAMITAVATG